MADGVPAWTRSPKAIGNFRQLRPIQYRSWKHVRPQKVQKTPKILTERRKELFTEYLKELMKSPNKGNNFGTLEWTVAFVGWFNKQNKNKIAPRDVRSWVNGTAAFDELLHQVPAWKRWSWLLPVGVHRSTSVSNASPGIASCSALLASRSPGVASGSNGVAPRSPGVASGSHGFGPRYLGVASGSNGVALRSPGVASGSHGVAYFLLGHSFGSPTVASGSSGVASGPRGVNQSTQVSQSDFGIANAEMAFYAGQDSSPSPSTEQNEW